MKSQREELRPLTSTVRSLPEEDSQDIAIMLEQPSGTENPSAWLRYATTQLQTVEPGEQAAKQQQQAAVAVRQAIRLGATERGSDETLHQAVLGCLLSGLEGSGVELRAAGPKDAEASGVS